MDPLRTLPPSARDLLQALRAHDDDDLMVSGSAQQAEEILALVRFQEMVDAELLRRLAVFDRTNGFSAVRCRSTHGFLRVHAQLSAGRAKHMVSMAERLDRLVTVRAAQAAGELSFDQVQILTKELAPIEDAEARRAAEELMVSQAPQLHLSHLRQAAQQIHAHLVPEPSPQAGEAPPAFQSWVRLSQTGTGDHPFWVLSGELCPVVGEKMRTALEAAMGEPAEGDPRTPSERMGDAVEVVADLALSSDRLPTTGCRRPQLTVTADVDALRASCPAHPVLSGDGDGGADRRPGEELAGLLRPKGVATTDRGYRLPRWEARKESCDCSLRVILTRGQGTVVSIGRSARTVPAHLRDAVIARDRHCVWPGCDRPPTWCEAHHLVHWADGGETGLANLALLCGEHHRDLHATGWELRMIDGRPRPVLPPHALPANSRYAA